MPFHAILSDVPRAVWFVTASIVLLLLAALAAKQQRKTAREGHRKIAQMAGVESPDSGYGLNRRSFLTTLAVAAIVFGLYPFVSLQVGLLPKQYFLIVETQYGALIHSAVGSLLWAPAIVLTISGMVSARRFSTRALLAMTDLKNDPERQQRFLRALLEHQHTWFFHRHELNLLLWGIVGTLAASLVFLADRGALLLSAAIAILVILLFYFFVTPVIAFGIIIAQAVRPVRASLEEALVREREKVIQRTAVGVESPTHSRPVLLQDTLNALPPSNVSAILAQQLGQTALGFMGPALGVLKIFMGVD